MGRLLEDGDELGLPWDEWADGRIWHLKQGRDFLRGTRAVDEAAQNAAARLGKAVKTLREVTGGSTVLWVQFADHQIELGDPCGGCGSSDLHRVNRHYAYCDDCGAQLLMVRPKQRRGGASPAPVVTARNDDDDDDDDDDDEFDDEPATAESVGAVERAAERSVAAAKRAELAWEEAERRAEEAETAERAAREAARRDAKLETLRTRAPSPEKQQRATTKAENEGRREAQPPLTKLTAFRNVRLFPYDHWENRERFYGFGETLDARQVLLLVDVPLVDGGRVPDPDAPGLPFHRLQCWPVAPFETDVDLSPLLERGDAVELTLSGEAERDEPAPASPAATD